MKRCEHCNAAPPDPPFGLHPYCTKCGRDLCETCLRDSECDEAVDGVHVFSTDDDDGGDDDDEA